MIESLPSDDYSALAKRWYAHQVRPRGKSRLPAIFERLESQGRTVTGREPSKPSFFIYDECAEISATMWADLGLARRAGSKPELFFMSTRHCHKTWFMKELEAERREAGRVAILRACRDFIASFKG